MSISPTYIATLQRIIKELKERKIAIEFQLRIMESELQDCLNEKLEERE
jgi:hypothetical protein